MIKNYYPRLKSVLGKCALAISSALMVFNSQSSIAQVTVSAVSPANAVPGTQITITGTGFNTTAANNGVYFGNVKATPTAATATQLTVNLPVGATYSDVNVVNTTTYGWGVSSQNYVPSFNNCYTAGSLSFKPKVDVGTATTPYAVGFADLDNDGKQDMVVAGTGSAQTLIRIYRNTGTPGVINSSTYPVTPSATATLTGGSSSSYAFKFSDLDRDGKLDLIVGCEGGQGYVSIFRNLSTSGTISFSACRPIPVFGKVKDVVVADFDGDGKPDIAVPSIGATGTGAANGFDSVKILRNILATPPTPLATASFSGATFAPHVSFELPTYAEPASICAGDFDGDGKPDLAVAHFSSSVFVGPWAVSVFRNTSTSGTIALGPRAELSVSGHPMQVIAADINSDNRQDIVVSATNFPSPNYLSVFQSSGVSGSITASSFTHTQIAGPADAGNMIGLAAGDLDADGDIDIAATYNSNAKFAVYKNVSAGSTISLSSTTAAAGFTTGSTPVGISIADIDGDNKPDIGVANSGSNNVSLFRSFGTPATGTITGSATACVPTTNAYTSSVIGGTWSLTNTVRATIDAVTGVLTPIAAGADTVIYTMTCNYDTATTRMGIVISVPPVVNPISGTSTSLCRTETITLTETTTGGTWSSSNSAIASVSGTTTATVYGISAGTATISYSLTNGCGTVSQTYGPITVRPTPGPITGTFIVCAGANISLSDTSSGTWSSLSPAVATINTSGVVHGVSAGTTVISYIASGGCGVSATVTVTAGPIITPITGSSSSVCLGSNLTLSNTTPSGTWSSSATSVASVNTSGVVHGNAVGTATISYSVTNGCGTDYVIYPVTVNAVPANITGSTFRVCQGSTITLNNTATGGTWGASGAVGISPAGTTVGVTGTGAGAAVISYTLASGCFDTALVTVDALPNTIDGASNVCAGSTTALSDISGPGTWSISPGTFATIGSSSGVVTGVSAGSSTVTFTQTSTGCRITMPFTTNALPAPISGSTIACVGATNMLTSSGSGTWSVTPTTVANIDPATGAVTGVLPGSATVTYALAGTGCSVSIPITVSPSPGVISGPATVCLGGFITLSDTPSTGVWFSSNAVVAPVNALGIVSGATLGTTTISFTVPSGCRATKTITVTPPPSPIVGSVPLCPLTTITLSDPTSGGVYSSGNPAIATVTSAGVVSGVSGGTVLISYTLLSTGCSVFTPVTVNPAPTVSGAPYVCLNHTSLLTVDSVAGIWTSSDTNTVKINAATGVIRGAAPGSALVTYTTAGYHCFDTVVVNTYDTVTPLISVTVSPTLSLSGHLASVCQNTTVTYTANIINGGPTPTFQWRVNGSVVGTGASYTYIPTNGDSISCRLTSSALCAYPLTSADYIKMNVIQNRTPILNLATGIGDTTCLGVPVTLNPNTIWGGTAPTYAWKVNGINVGPGSTFTYVPANGDVITVTVHSNYICRLVDTANDTLHLTVSPYLTPSIIVLGSDTTCEGYPTVYTAIAVNGGTAPTFQWRVNTINAGTGSTLAYMATDGDVVDVTMTSNFPCLTYSVTTSPTHTVHVEPVPIPSISLAVTPGYILAPGMTATFIATPVNPGPNPTYVWKKNGVIIPGATSLTYSTNVFAFGDSFTVIMTTNSLCNHISTYASVEVFVGDNVGISQVNSPNSVLNIVPNPTNGKFSVIGNTGISSNEEVGYEITNMLGQVVYRSHGTTTNGAIEEHLELDANLANGMYLLNVRSEHLSRNIHFELAR